MALERKLQNQTFLERPRAEIAKSINPRAGIAKSYNPIVNIAKTWKGDSNVNLNVRWPAHKHVLVRHMHHYWTFREDGTCS
jgi:hypothetical protein